MRGGSHNIQLDRAVAVARTVDAWLRTGDAGDAGAGSVAVAGGPARGAAERLLLGLTDSRVEEMGLGEEPLGSGQPARARL